MRRIPCLAVLMLTVVGCAASHEQPLARRLAAEKAYLEQTLQEQIEGLVTAANAQASASGGQVLVQYTEIERVCYFVPLEYMKERMEEEMRDGRTVYSPGGPPDDAMMSETWKDQYALAQKMDWRWQVQKVGPVLQQESLNRPYQAAVTFTVEAEWAAAVAENRPLPPRPPAGMVYWRPSGLGGSFFGIGYQSELKALPGIRVPGSAPEKVGQPLADEAVVLLAEMPVEKLQGTLVADFYFSVPDGQWHGQTRSLQGLPAGKWLSDYTDAPLNVFSIKTYDLRPRKPEERPPERERD